jgi:hypothetical protein
VGKNHLARTRGSGLRRSLAAVLVDELELRSLVVPGPSGKFGLPPGVEPRLTEWMLAHLQVTWVPLEAPGAEEEAIIRELLPVLNHEHATGSPYRAILARMRSELRAEGVAVDLGFGVAEDRFNSSPNGHQWWSWRSGVLPRISSWCCALRWSLWSCRRVRMGSGS